jgi:hypothetical protein
MNWTTEKPKVPGWYWWREPGHDGDKDKEIIQLWPDGEVLRPGRGHEWHIDGLSGEFAGPILEPGMIDVRTCDS